MEPLIWNATSAKPFGRSRLKRAIRSLIDDYIRTVANATIALEFDTTPQKYLLGVTDEQYDAIMSDKFRQYVGNILTATTNPETGENPEFGQLVQGSLTPVSYTHLDVYKRQRLHLPQRRPDAAGGRVLSHIPVSYTHLDVYKRQVAGGT